MNTQRTNPMRNQRGFSLVELLVALFILTIVFAVVMQGIMELQRRNSAENAKMDITQSARDFVDQAVRDLHEAGFPNTNMYNAPASPAINNVNVAAGLVSVNPNSVQFEGDLDGNGIVQSVTIQVIGSDGVTVGGTCPCALRRGAIAKVAGSPFQQPAGAQGIPTSYSELPNVAANNVFSAYDKYGFAVPLPIDLNTAAVATASPASPVTINDIKAIRLNVFMQSPNPDLQNKSAPIVSMTSEARIYN